MTPIRTWLVEADASYRQSLEIVRELEKSIAVKQIFSSCVELFDGLESGPLPDVVLMDLESSGKSSLEAIRKLVRIVPDVAVVVLTALEDKVKALAALKAGAAGCLLKESEPLEIGKGVQQVFSGGSVLSPMIAKAVVEELHQSLPAEEFDLSQREIEVLEQLVDGLAVKEISAALHVSVSTIGFHLTNIYKKLDVQSQTGAVAKAVRAGIV